MVAEPGQNATPSRRENERAVWLAEMPEQSPAPILRLASDLTLLYQNQAARVLLGPLRLEVGARVPRILAEPVARLAAERLPRLQAEVSCGDHTFLMTFSSADGQVNVFSHDITPRKRAEAASQELRDRLAAELAGMARLAALSTLLVPQGDWESLLRAVLSAAIDITGASTGVIHVADPATGGLLLAVHQGLRGPFLERSRWRRPGEGSCWLAFEGSKRIIVDDVAVSALHASPGEASAFLEAGVRGLVSTPLVARSGHVLGVFCVHFPSPHRPQPRELHMLDLLARQAADWVERTQAEAALGESEARLRSIFEHSPVGIALADLEGRVVLCNPTFASILGYAPSELAGKAFAALTHPEDREREWELAFDLLAGVKSQYALEKRFIKKNGEVIWARMTGSLTRGAHGKPVTPIAVIEDISAERRAAEELRATAERFRLAQEAGRVGVFDWDVTTNRMRWTTELEAIYGMASGTFGGTFDAWASRVHPDDQARIAGFLAEWQSCADRTENNVEFRIVRVSDGAVRWVAARGRLFFDDERRPVRMIGTNTDITDRKDVEEALREADRNKNEFLAMLSHELRNPLSPIRAGIYVLQHAKRGGEEASRALAAIDRQTEQLTRLIDDLLDVTRVSRGKIRLDRELFDLDALVGGSAEDNREAFEKNGVELVVEGLEGPPLQVHADRARIAQIISNLLANAVKFTPRGGRTTLSLEHDAGYAVIRVRDSGVGISADQLAKLFQPFMQIERTLSRSRGGLGLGLALVKAFTEMHGGTVGVRSEGTGRGSEFTVRLPLASAVSRRRPTPAMAPPRAAPSRVLIIEDNPDAAASLQQALELGAHVVAAAGDGEAGLDAARSFKPDVVICDLGLPGIDGYEVARVLRADPELCSIQLIALSGFALKEDVQRSREAGFDEHVKKPPDFAALERMLGGGPACSPRD